MSDLGERTSVTASDSDPSGEIPLDPAADAALLEESSAELAAVDDALRRLDDETYGRCEVCGTELDTEQVQADPLATRCPSHQS